ncbi:hypothetical protein DSM106972_084910 [Dulcicalothrix desertica PCC 7102]|uniref:dTDP-4-dehydrorhamnose 3,5-epimerase n=1 Tax=Dulcicalothrix desertica PCC 7102 TaxID=232991 RepID=A0A3S1C6B8_9CYAN|nr:dTDP-4-dehydrorhamnose 3,5-epimerase [Dulcicalothrix desertica]RUS97388.1 hypothetical protein DSM106972_084910 [Dulcicalothrix desertica PCC 7102]TWH55566.1 hypothetical protein CAL7102_03713 [Dulcicalothrix desertica PCC 7102]
MNKPRGITIRHLESIKGGMAQFFTPQASNETMLVQVPPNAVDDLFVHKSQTDQILVVKGEFVLVTLIDRKYQYIPLSEKQPAVAIIPPGVLHGAINFSSEACVVVNAVLRHRPVQPLDYVTRGRPFPYDLEAAKSALENLKTISTSAPIL